MKKLYIFVFAILGFSLSCFGESIFDSVKWTKDYEDKGISLFYQYDEKANINFYKAETVINTKNGDKFFTNLIDFNKYPQIFPKIFVSKIVEDFTDTIRSGIMYFDLNFCPFKNREYFVNYKYFTEETSKSKRYVVEWWPISDKKFSDPAKNKVRVNLIYGRWQIVETDGKTKISVEYYNDFKVNGPSIIVQKIEKESTVDAIKNLLKFTFSNNSKVGLTESGEKNW